MRQQMWVLVLCHNSSLSRFVRQMDIKTLHTSELVRDPQVENDSLWILVWFLHALEDV